jgi:hypothetical protein
MGLVILLCALGHASAATITIDDVEAFKVGKHTGYSFDLNIDWDDGAQKWTDLNTDKKSNGKETFSAVGWLTLNKKGEPTFFDNDSLEGKYPSNAAWAYRMDISLYQTASGEWDWHGTIQRWEKGIGENKNKLVLAGEINKPMHTPIPGAAWLLGAGLIGLVGVRYRFRKSKAQRRQRGYTV